MELRALKSWYTHEDGWVTLEDDVLSIVRQIRDLYGTRITVELNQQTGDYVLVEHCIDGEMRLIFTTAELDGRVIDRLCKGDSQSRAYRDPYSAAEIEQDRLQSEIDKQYAGYIGEAAAQLVHVMKRDGMAPRLPLQKSMFIPEKEQDADR